MSERIQELYMQAIEYADSVVPAERRYNDIYYAIASGKHAQLIVQECMEQVWYTREDGINGNISQVVKDRIKEHFGVEE
jgi:hypothetical protein